jgi:hypothetical protein
MVCRTGCRRDNELAWAYDDTHSGTYRPAVNVTAVQIFQHFLSILL